MEGIGKPFLASRSTSTSTTARLDLKYNLERLWLLMEVILRKLQGCFDSTSFLKHQSEVVSFSEYIITQYGIETKEKYNEGYSEMK
jgi:hypothetical protein